MIDIVGMDPVDPTTVGVIVFGGGAVDCGVETMGGAGVANGVDNDEEGVTDGGGKDAAPLAVDDAEVLAARGIDATEEDELDVPEADNDV